MSALSGLGGLQAQWGAPPSLSPALPARGWGPAGPGAQGHEAIQGAKPASGWGDDELAREFGAEAFRYLVLGLFFFKFCCTKIYTHGK